MPLLSNIFGCQNFFKKSDTKITIILLLAALIPTLHQYFGVTSFFYKLIPSDSSIATESVAVGYFFLTAFFLMGIIPFLLIKIVFKEKLLNYGLQLGDWKKGLYAVGVLFPIIAIAFLLPAAFQEEINTFYPLYKGADKNAVSFLNFELIRGLFFYSAWEFFFRGFILFGIRNSVNDWTAILIQTIPSCLWHIGYPTGEILMSIPAGIMFGIIALRTNSIIWVWLLHWLIGIGLDFFIILVS